MRDTGFEPVAFGSGGGHMGSPAVHSASQGAGFTRNRDHTPVQRSQPLAANTNPFAATFAATSSPALAGVRGGADDLISVREVAKRLGVSTATVYRLCDSGALPHVRVSNAIRFAPEAIAAFAAPSPSAEPQRRRVRP